MYQQIQFPNRDLYNNYPQRSYNANIQYQQQNVAATQYQMQHHQSSVAYPGASIRQPTGHFPNYQLSAAYPAVCTSQINGHFQNYQSSVAYLGASTSQPNGNFPNDQSSTAYICASTSQPDGYFLNYPNNVPVQQNLSHQFVESQQHMPIIAQQQRQNCFSFNGINRDVPQPIPMQMLPQNNTAPLDDQQLQDYKEKSRMYRCSTCDKAFKSIARLNQHFATAYHKMAVKRSKMPDPALKFLNQLENQDEELNIHTTASTELLSSGNPSNLVHLPQNQCNAPYPNMVQIAVPQNYQHQHQYFPQSQMAPQPSQTLHGPQIDSPANSLVTPTQMQEQTLSQNQSHIQISWPTTNNSGDPSQTTITIPVERPATSCPPSPNAFFLDDTTMTLSEVLKCVDNLLSSSSDFDINELLNYHEQQQQQQQQLEQMQLQKTQPEQMELQEVMPSLDSSSKSNTAKNQQIDIREFIQNFNEDDFMVDDNPISQNDTHPSLNPNSEAVEIFVEPGDCQEIQQNMGELQEQPQYLVAKENNRPNLTTSERSKESVVTTEKMFNCLECNKTFNKACYLTQHNNTFHSGEKPFKCDICGKRFFEKTKQKKHEEKHTSVKPHKCDICPKTFLQKTDLKRHLITHTGEKPYHCDVCRKDFIRKDHMMNHIITHYKALLDKNPDARNKNFSEINFINSISQTLNSDSKSIFKNKLTQYRKKYENIYHRKSNPRLKK